MISDKRSKTWLRARRKAPWLAFLSCLAVLVCAGSPAAQDKVSAKKKSLEEIRQQLDDKKKELEKYKEEETRINSEITSLKKADKLNVARQKELESQLTRTRSRSSESREKHDALSKAYRELQGDLYGEAVRYSLDKHFYYPYYGLVDISRGLLLKSAILQKHSMITRIKGETAKVRDDIQTLIRQNTELKTRKGLVDRQRSAQKNIVKDKMTELERAKARQARLSREVENLQNAALGLTRLVRKLEKQLPYKSVSGKSKELSVPRHSLPWPVQGRVISRYGREQIPALKTWIVREGIRIRSADSAPVFPVMNGKVIYSGPFRTYGNVVIVDHEQAFFTVYGLLDNILVSRNDSVTPSSPLGRAGTDTQAVSGPEDKDYSAVYFEIRVGVESVDPLIWLTN